MEVNLSHFIEQTKREAVGMFIEIVRLANDLGMEVNFDISVGDVDLVVDGEVKYWGSLEHIGGVLKILTKLKGEENENK